MGTNAMNGQNPDTQRVMPTVRGARRALAPTVSKDSAPVDPPKPHGRHAAITGNFNSWREYKRWAETMRSAWDAGDKLGS